MRVPKYGMNVNLPVCTEVLFIPFVLRFPFCAEFSIKSISCNNFPDDVRTPKRLEPRRGSNMGDLLALYKVSGQIKVNFFLFLTICVSNPCNISSARHHSLSFFRSPIPSLKVWLVTWFMKKSDDDSTHFKILQSPLRPGCSDDQQKFLHQFYPHYEHFTPLG